VVEDTGKQPGIVHGGQWGVRRKGGRGMKKEMKNGIRVGVITMMNSLMFTRE
jgi:hypothetical protein